jgi:retinol dehydrogenase 12
MANHFADDGILTFSLNPGGIRTELQRHAGSFWNWISDLFLSPAPMGAINQLFAATSPTLTQKDNGKYFIPWAREAAPAKGVQDPALADKLWDFLEKETAGKY